MEHEFHIIKTGSVTRQGGCWPDGSGIVGKIEGDYGFIYREGWNDINKSHEWW